MEGQVYLCSWEQVGARFRVWWTARPKVSAEGDTFDDADEALYEAIGIATGDCENSHEYEPPRPGSEMPDVGPDLVMIGGETYAWAETHEGIFEGGLCPECRKAIGQRTSKPVEMRSMQSGPRNGGSISVLRSTFIGPKLHFVSAEFRALLTPDEDSQFEWREIVGPPGSRKKFFELVSARLVVPLVKPLAAPPFGWRCELCGHVTSAFTAATSWKGPNRHVARSEVESMGSEVFAIGSAPEFHFCCTRRRWRALLALPGAKGCRSYDIGVLDEDHVDRAPLRRTWREMNAEAAAMEAARIAREPKRLRSLRIALGEYDTGWQSPVKSLTAAGKVVRAAKAARADLVVLPEMCTTGFTMDPARTETADGERIRQLGKLAQKSRIHMLAGVSLREQQDGRERIVNAALHLDVHGDIVATYRQQRLSADADEHAVYAAGGESLTEEIYWVRLAYFIGTELRFPELFRAVAPDVDAMIVVANWPAAHHAEWDTLLRQRAIENGCYVIGVNRTGKGGGIEYGGGSKAFDPAGEPTGDMQDGILCVDVEQSRVAEVRDGVLSSAGKQLGK